LSPGKHGLGEVHPNRATELAKLAQFHEIKSVAAPQIEDPLGVLDIRREDLKYGGAAKLKIPSLAVTHGERVEKFLNVASKVTLHAWRGIRILAGHG